MSTTDIDLVKPDRKAVAAARAEAIRTNLEQAAHLYAVAVHERDWETLGYKSVGEWVTKELGPSRWKPEARQEIGAYLLDHGHTFREVGKALDVSPATVAADQAGRVQEPNTSSARQQAARRREQRKVRHNPAINPATYGAEVRAAIAARQRGTEPQLTPEEARQLTDEIKARMETDEIRARVEQVNNLLTDPASSPKPKDREPHTHTVESRLTTEITCTGCGESWLDDFAERDIKSYAADIIDALGTQEARKLAGRITREANNMVAKQGKESEGRAATTATPSDTGSPAEDE